jgi:hypothetical protein
MKRLSSRTRRVVAALALVSAGVGGSVGTALATGSHNHAVANPHFACLGIGKFGICIGPPGT